jgi:hypothetical protein
VAPPQAVSQAPQWARLLRVSTQESPHFVRPVPHVIVQTPPLQTRPAPQAVPQAPQFWASLSRETHTGPQDVWAGGQTHAPPLQIVPPPHAAAQAPQFAGSEASSTQAPAHGMRPGAHEAAQTPRSHTWFVWQA